MQRIAAFRATALMGRRFYAPPAALKELYQSDFDRQAYPVDIVPSDATLFAKFLYKAAEKSGNFDSILGDFAKIGEASKKLPIFWERTAVIDDIKEFSSLTAPTIFVLNWMRSNGMLEQIADVSAAFETYVNAKAKKVVAKIYVAPGQEKNAGIVNAAKEAAQKLHKAAAATANFTLDYKVVADSAITEGFSVDVNGAFVSNAKGADVADASAAAKEVDYTSVPASKFAKTKWEDSIETEVLRKYFDQLAAFDAEEAKYGV
jgi:F0F1-type ATP synthase delta subunit